MLRNIVLHGEMAGLFGDSFRIDVGSISEAARALSVQVKGFENYLREHNFHLTCGRTPTDGLQLDVPQLQMHLPQGDIHIIPAIAGAKHGGLGKIIVGLLIAAAAFFVTGPLAPTLGLAGGLGAPLLGGITGGNLMVLGLGLAVAGLAKILTPQQQTPPESDSYSFGGALNVTQQGGCVPLIYGREIMVGSVLISGGLSQDDIGQGGFSFQDR